MAQDISGKRIAILATDGFEQSELTEPCKALKQAGATVDVVAPKPGTIHGFRHMEPGEEVAVDQPLDRADPDDYDGLVLPGGLYNPDRLRTDETARAFVRAFMEAGKPVAAICHGPQTLISADLVRGRTMTGAPSILKDLENAGARVVDREVVVDKGLVTSRTPEDLPAFCGKMIEEFAEGRHEDR